MVLTLCLHYYISWFSQLTLKIVILQSTFFSFHPNNLNELKSTFELIVLLLSGVSNNPCPWDGSCTTCHTQCQEYNKKCPTDISVTIDADKKESPIYNKIGNKAFLILRIRNLSALRLSVKYHVLFHFKPNMFKLVWVVNEINYIRINNLSTDFFMMI